MTNHIKEYMIIFDGNFKSGFEAEQVKKNINNLLKLSPDASKRLFSEHNKPLTIKKFKSFSKAENFCSKLSDFGMILKIKSVQIASEADLNICEDESSSTKNKLLIHALVLKIPILMLIISLIFVINYDPFSDGILRNGFLVGVVLLLLSSRYIKNKLKYIEDNKTE